MRGIGDDVGKGILVIRRLPDYLKIILTREDEMDALPEENLRIGEEDFSFFHMQILLANLISYHNINCTIGIEDLGLGKVKIS